jgi:apolipoprotein N-acyltransferase
MLPLLAEKPLEKLHNVSGQFWVAAIVFFIALAVALLLIRKVMGMNKIILVIIGCVVLGVVGFNWIYERNEPQFLTPYINTIAPFFPSKGAYDNKQTQDPSAPGIHKNAPATPAAKPASPAAPPTKK